jgi:hypothetical protein
MANTPSAHGQEGRQSSILPFCDGKFVGRTRIEIIGDDRR